MTEEVPTNKGVRQSCCISPTLFNTHTHTHTHTPVSYTHLDVYKRQDFRYSEDKPRS